MKYKTINYGQSSKLKNAATPPPAAHAPRAPFPSVPSSILHLTSSRFLLGVLAVSLALATGGCSLRQAYPETQIRGYINGQPFSVNAPKDSTLNGFDAIAETNGTIHVHIDSLQAALNPTNLANAANGQAAIVTATAQALNQAFQTAAATALKAAATP